MSRIAKSPITVPDGVDINIDGQRVSLKTSKGLLEYDIHPEVEIAQDDNVIQVAPRAETSLAWALAGTTRALINNMVTGLTNGFEKKLQLVGVGYRAQAQGKVLNISVGLSHPVNFEVPEGVTIDTPSPTEIVVKGMDKQLVGQVAANIRSYRPPEPYKGKGIKYADEHIVRKEAKKK